MYNRTHLQDVDEEDFSQYVRKKVRRYHISGFKSNMTQYLITRYVERRNVTITWVTLFPIKNSNRITIRLNVEENSNTDNVTEDWFWPSNVTCRLWESWNSYKNRIGNRRQPRENDSVRNNDSEPYHGRNRHHDNGYSSGSRYTDNNYENEDDY